MINKKLVKRKIVPSIYQRLKRRYEKRMNLNKQPNIAERLAAFKRQKNNKK